MLTSTQKNENARICALFKDNSWPLFDRCSSVGVARILVSCRPSSVNLVIGARASLWVNDIMRGLDINSRLVLLNDSREVAAGLKEILRSDLRYTIHHQDYLSFLDDVRRYAFSLCVVDAQAGVTTFENTMNLLDQGGAILLLGEEGAAFNFDDCECALISEKPYPIRMICARPSLAQPTTRRGGRRARRTVSS